MAVAGNVGFLVGLPLGGLAVGLLGAGTALRVDNAASFVLEAGLVALLSRPGAVPGAKAGAGEGRWGEALAGARWLAGDRVLAVCTVGLAVSLVCVTSVNVAEVFVPEAARRERDGLRAGVRRVGGGLAPRLVGGRTAAHRRGATARAVLGSCVLLGAGLVVASLGGFRLELGWVVVGWVVAGAGNGVAVVASSSLVRARTPDERRGRVFAALQVLYQGANVSSLLLGAALVGLVGAAETLALAGRRRRGSRGGVPRAARTRARRRPGRSRDRRHLSGQPALDLAGQRVGRGLDIRQRASCARRRRSGARQRRCLRAVDVPRRRRGRHGVPRSVVVHDGPPPGASLA